MAPLSFKIRLYPQWPPWAWLNFALKSSAEKKNNQVQTPNGADLLVRARVTKKGPITQRFFLMETI